MPRKSWWARLPFGVRMATGTSALLIAIGGGAAGIAALTTDHKDTPPQIVTAVGQPAQAAPREAAGGPAPAAPPPVMAPRTSDDEVRRTAANEKADRTSTRDPRSPVAASSLTNSDSAATKKAPAPKAPVTTTRTDVETNEIPFRTRLVRDPSLPRGTKQVQTQGVPGVQTLRYLVTLVDGKQVDRKLLDTTVTREPQHRVVAYGSARRGGDMNHDRRCEFRVCMPFGRKICERNARDESALQLGGSVVVLDRDVELLNPETLDGMSGVTC
ncbi:hypothetical protein HH310_04360 [Actinoplanes sp. TBRC 11911]|uniref:G5 domain-containing protein n=1 Tax=Actinoplanes sp. TBRC 11911 TaxID=2729386 RepID=UPI00145FBEF6|nr:G5 domain-containing protein [Actinoplanes sp. TBRC 11911]NMO50425.1 hypothetical protein [Actinoplanes sp. TBRC 11911]